MFIAKLDSNGDTNWAHGIEGNIIPSDIDIDNLGNIYIAGSYWDVAVIGNDTLFPFVPPPNESDVNIFLCKFDANGQPIWALSEGGEGQDEAVSIDVDNFNNLYIGGNFDASAFFGGIDTITTPAKQGAFIAKYNTIGNFQWVRQSLGANVTSRSSVSDVSIDYLGNVFATGHFEDSVHFENTLLLNWGDEMFIAKYSSIGDLEWIHQIDTNNNIFCWSGGNAVAVDSLGNVYATGYFYGEATFGNTTLSSLEAQAYIVKYTSGGDIDWAEQTYGSSQGGYSGSFSPTALVVHSSSTIYITGIMPYDSLYFPMDTFNCQELFCYDVIVAKMENLGTGIWNVPDKEMYAVNVYPNPTQSEIVIEINDNGLLKKMEIFDINGLRVFCTESSAIKSIISIEELQAGMYMLRISGTQHYSTHKIIKIN